MLALISQVLLIVSPRFTEELILNEVNNKGPTAWSSGVRCLDTVAQAYFLLPGENITRPERLVLSHITNMSSPAAEIEELYRRKQHQKATCVNCNGPGRQFMVVADILENSTVFLRENVSKSAIVASDFYVIVIDDLDRLIDFFANYLSRTVTWNPGAKFLILYINVDDYDGLDYITHEVFSCLLNDFKVIDVMLLFATNATSYEVLQLNYYSKSACRSAQVRKLATCHKGKLPGLDYNKIRINQKKKNILLDNCTFKACCKIAQPFVESNCHDGLELRLLEVIREIMGFHLELNCTTTERGILDNNDTWTGLLQWLGTTDCDFIMGGFYPDHNVRNDFWVTSSYLRDSYTWFVGNAPLKPPWKGLISIFAPNTWRLILFVLFFTWLTWFTIGKLHREDPEHRSVSLTALNNLGVALGISVNERPRLPPLRLFYIGLILFGLNITSIYTSNLIAAFANPQKDDQISTVEEMLKRKLPFGGPKENKEWFCGNNRIYKDYNDTKEFESTVDNLKLVANHKQAILANRMFVLQSNYSDHVYGFREDVFLSHLEMIMERGFPLLNKFNEIIGYMMDMGFFNKITNDFNYKNTYLKYIREHATAEEADITLTLEHLNGAFTILLVGLSFSIMVFIMELIAHAYITPRYKKIPEWHTHRLLWEDFNPIITRNRQYPREKALQTIRLTNTKRRKIKGKEH